MVRSGGAMVRTLPELDADSAREALGAVRRRQVLDGLSRAIAAKGYAATTIADLAREARVSKSAVYEHFADKEAAFLALHREIVAEALQTVQRAYEHSAAAPTWEERTRQIVSAYLRAMTADPVHFTVALVEVVAVSTAARRARRDAVERFAAAVVGLSAQTAAEHAGASALSPSLALAAIGGLNELVMRAAEEGPEAVRALEPVATDVLVRLIRDPKATT